MEIKRFILTKNRLIFDTETLGVDDFVEITSEGVFVWYKDNSKEIQVDRVIKTSDNYEDLLNEN